MKKKFIAHFWLVFIFIICLLTRVIAQPSIDYDDVLDNEVPFDGGVFLLIGAAIGYGLKNIPAKKNKIEN